MKKFLVILAALILIIIPVAGCGGEETPTTSPITEITNRVSAVEATAANLSSQLGTKADKTTLSALQNEVNNLQSSVASLNTGAINNNITTLTTRLNAVDGLIDDLQAQLDNFEVPDVELPEVISVVGELGTNKITLTTVSSVQAAVVFEITFHISDLYEIDIEELNDALGTHYGEHIAWFGTNKFWDDTPAALDDIIRFLYTDSPVVLAYSLPPTFKVLWDDDDQAWYLYEIVFSTIGTTINAGETVKVANVTETLGGGVFVTVQVSPIAVKTTGGGSVW